jgi:hypothetical protein
VQLDPLRGARDIRRRSTDRPIRCAAAKLPNKGFLVSCHKQSKSRYTAGGLPNRRGSHSASRDVNPCALHAASSGHVIRFERHQE